MKKERSESENELLTVRGVSRRLIISERTVYNKLSAGTFPIKPIRVGRLLRFRTEDINTYIESL